MEVLLNTHLNLYKLYEGGMCNLLHLDGTNTYRNNSKTKNFNRQLAFNDNSRNTFVIKSNNLS